MLRILWVCRYNVRATWKYSSRTSSCGRVCVYAYVRVGAAQCRGSHKPDKIPQEKTTANDLSVSVYEL